MYYYPPAVSDFGIGAVVWRSVQRASGSLDEALCGAVGCEAAVSADSWVKLLAELFKELSRGRRGREVVLARYSCNEFTKAILLAGLEPVYVEVDESLRTGPEAIEGALSEDTCIVLAINNVGVETGNERIAALCRKRGIPCVEDATYTYLGISDRSGRPFGSFGDFAILNFSEGKIIPIGGGAVLLNNGDYADVFDRLAEAVRAAEPASSSSEMMALLKYKAGSSLLGYSAYRYIRRISNVDLKQRMSMEVTRTGQVGVDLESSVDGVAMKAARQAELDVVIPLRPLNSVKQLCGVHIVDRIDEYRRRRLEAYHHLRRLLESEPHVTFFSLPERGVPVRVPVLLEGVSSPDIFERLNRLGVCNHYTTDYPMYGDPAFPNANRYYESLYTLPVHRHVNVNALVQSIKDIRPNA